MAGWCSVYLYDRLNKLHDNLVGRYKRDQPISRTTQDEYGFLPWQTSKQQMRQTLSAMTAADAHKSLADKIQGTTKNTKHPISSEFRDKAEVVRSARGGAVSRRTRSIESVRRPLVDRTKPGAKARNSSCDRLLASESPVRPHVSRRDAIEQTTKTTRTLQSPMDVVVSKRPLSEKTNLTSVSTEPVGEWTQNARTRRKPLSSNVQTPVKAMKRNPSFVLAMMDKENLARSKQVSTAKRCPCANASKTTTRTRLTEQFQSMSLEESNNGSRDSGVDCSHREDNTGLTRESCTPMVVIRNYFPSAKGTQEQEVNLQKGELVAASHFAGSRLFIRTADDRTGYVPASVLKPVLLQKCPKSRTDFAQQFPDPDIIKPLNLSVASSLDTYISLNSSGHSSMSPTSQSGSSISGESMHQDSIREARSFLSLQELPARQRSPVYLSSKNDPDSHVDSSLSESGDKRPQLTVFFAYQAVNEYDVSVLKQEVVTLLNDDDKDWIWIQKETGEEGFMPRTYATDLSLCNLDPHTKTTYL